MKKARSPKSGRKKPVVYESTKREIHKTDGKPSIETRTRRVVRLPLSLAFLILMSILFIPEESRAFVSTAADYLFDVAKSWILRPTLS